MKSAKNLRALRLLHGFCFLALCCLILLSSACVASSPGASGQPTPTAGTRTPQGQGHPPTASMPPTETSCPAQGTARAAVMPPLMLGKHPMLVYAYNTGSAALLKRYNVASGQKTVILSLPDTAIGSAQISADGQWVLFVAHTHGDPPTQHVLLVRSDGQGLQTLFCGDAYPESALWSPDQHFLLLWGGVTIGQMRELSVLNITTGAVQTVLSSSGSVYQPLTWLDNTRVYVSGQVSPIGSAQTPPPDLSLLDIQKGSEQTDADLQLVTQLAPCWSADRSADSASLFLSTCTRTDAGTSSSITEQPATGGSPRVMYQDSQHGVVTVRAVAVNLLLLIENETGDVSQNGLWTMHVDGSGLTRLTVDPSQEKKSQNLGPEQLNAQTQFSWSNISRDGSMYALKTTFKHDNRVSGDEETLLVGSLGGGSPTTFASTSGDGSEVDIVGWTTM